MLRQFAPAKVNLSLHVTGRRADGYHLLESLVVFADVGDTLGFAPAPAFSLEIGGPFGASLEPGPDNLVRKAAAALERAFPGRIRGAHIRLDKVLPVAAGLGGGSADAAATLRGLAALSGLDPGADALAGVALGIGADVPGCLGCRAALMSGIGERLAPAPPLPPLPAVLVNPGVAVATGAVFAALCLDPGEPARAGLAAMPPQGFTDAAALAAHLAGCRNDLEAAAIGIAPEIAPALDALSRAEGCLLSRMSGSGATCFGLFATDDAADRAADALRARQPAWWITSTTLA